MANYSTLLTTWGDTGSVYPGGYSYIEGEQPVDEWDNFFNANVITDLQHLISLTNQRVESRSGPTSAKPSSPSGPHLYHDTDKQRIEFWDSDSGSWEVLVTPGQTMEGPLDMGGYGISNVGGLGLDGNVDLGGNALLDGATTIYDPATGKFSDADTVDGMHASDLGSGASDSGTPVLSTATDFNFGSNLQVSDDGDGTVTINAQVPDADLTDISEDGNQVVANASDINFIGHLNVTDDGDGSVTIDPTHNHDSRYYTQSESDSRYASSGHSHDSRYYTKSQSNSNYAPSSHNHDSRYYTESEIDSKRGKLKHFSSVSAAENDGSVDVGDMVYITGDSKVYVKTA